uniref:Endonuclease/exonuclease/phosphatase domain-containing protein n=1 Tax=viral metagenome TaxID=1070528 RepID=A0A6C0D6M0_9ZZZZ
MNRTLKNKNKPKQVGGNNSINVLCWNICWQAMKGEAKGSAPILGAKCAEREINRRTKLNECSTNVRNLIDSLPINYDFVAIQEATKWKEIYNHSKKLRAMGGYVHHRIGSSELVTFYNKDKYNAKAVVTYTIIHNGKRGRPYHIIYLQHIITLEFYIFINLHNAVGVSKDDLELQLASKFNNFFEIEKVEQEGAQHLKKRIQPLWSKNNYNVIVAGDFNDRGLKNYWQGLYPFKHTNIPILKDIVVKCEPEPPKTCCRQLKNTSPPYNGDYILVNSSLAIEKNNYIPASAHLFPSSDHLPVLIELKSITAVSAPIVRGVRTRAQTINHFDTVLLPDEKDEEIDELIDDEESDEESDEEIDAIIQPPPDAIRQPPDAIRQPPDAIIPRHEETGPTSQIEGTGQIEPDIRPPPLPPIQAAETILPLPPTQGTETILPPPTRAEIRPPPPIQGETRQSTQVVETIPPTQGAPTQGAPTQGAPTQGAPTQGAPTQGAPTQGPPTQTETRQPTQVVEARPLTQEAVQPPIEKKDITRETETEPESTNMFSAPLMAMICAIPVIFLLSK